MFSYLELGKLFIPGMSSLKVLCRIAYVDFKRGFLSSTPNVNLNSRKFDGAILPVILTVLWLYINRSIASTVEFFLKL